MELNENDFIVACKQRDIHMIELSYEIASNDDIKRGLDALVVINPYPSNRDDNLKDTVKKDNEKVLPILEHIRARLNADTNREGLDLSMCFVYACSFDLSRMKILLNFNKKYRINTDSVCSIYDCLWRATVSPFPFAIERMKYLLSLEGDLKIDVKRCNNLAFQGAIESLDPERIECFLALKDKERKNDRRQTEQDIIKVLSRMMEYIREMSLRQMEILLPLLNKYGFFNTDAKLLTYRNIAMKHLDQIPLIMPSEADIQREKTAEYLLDYIKQLITVSKLHKGKTSKTGEPIKLTPDNATDISKFLFNIKPIEKII